MRSRVSLDRNGRVLRRDDNWALSVFSRSTAPRLSIEISSLILSSARVLQSSRMAPAFRGRRKACWRPRLRRQHKNSEPSRRPTDDVSAKQAMSDLEEKRAIDIAAAGSSTPKAKTSRIPEHLSCPPAPKKRRVTGLRWSESTPPVPFFTSPDLDLFFLYALREISL
ncbi:hypothetical protein OPV22_008968 [Ensete ventricosum]|uniref:Uncharacterized protein n=1 Tax=Ensete ventricosum TaxID=4639 RepID=A0AAV8RHD3_ENSVE|nr:hypothetical protein OPV22_008968 [Ensete ventricosum]